MRINAAVLLAGLVLTLGGCADTADVFPINPAAKQLGPVHASFVRTGVGRGPVTITMADGEMLHGEYRVAFSTAMGSAYGSSIGPHGSRTWNGTALVIQDGPVQFVAHGPKTEMLCRGFSTTMGHGNGECQTFEGAEWAISW